MANNLSLRIESSGLAIQLTGKGECMITGVGNCIDSRILVPKEIRKLFSSYKVTEIGAGAFKNCEHVTEIELPSTITKIGADAFSGCDRLSSINIPSKVTEIGSGAFEGCTALLSITLPDSVEIIEPDLFSKCVNLEGVTLGRNVREIGSCAFEGCFALSGITLPMGLKEIGRNAFFGCERMTSIEIPRSVERIEDGAFLDCLSLESITLPFIGDSCDNVTDACFGSIFGAVLYIDNSDLVPKSLKHVVLTGGYAIFDNAFNGCSDIESIVIPATARGIGRGAFHGCKSLKSLTVDEENRIYYSIDSCIIEKSKKTLVAGCVGSIIPTDGSVKSIGDEAFVGCLGLESIVIPDKITRIGEFAFKDCSELKSVIIPDSVTSIGFGAFSQCNTLESMTLPFVGGSSDDENGILGYIFGGKTFGDNIFCVPKTLCELKLTGAEKLHESALSGCVALERLSIPDSVKEIGGSALSGCVSLCSIRYEGSAAKWNAINKGEQWDFGTGKYTLECGG